MNRKLHVREQRIRELEMLLEAERGKVASLEGTLQKLLSGLGRSTGNDGSEKANGRCVSSFFGMARETLM